MGGKPPDWFGRKTQNSATSQERLVENEMIRSGSGGLGSEGLNGREQRMETSRCPPPWLLQGVKGTSFLFL